MARLDRTFTNTDVIRIYENNLDVAEQELVRQYFDALTTQNDQTNRYLQLVQQILDLLVPQVGALFEISGTLDSLLQGTEIYDDVIGAISAFFYGIPLLNQQFPELTEGE